MPFCSLSAWEKAQSPMDLVKRAGEPLLESRVWKLAILFQGILCQLVFLILNEMVSICSRRVKQSE